MAATNVSTKATVAALASFGTASLLPHSIATPAVLNSSPAREYAVPASTRERRCATQQRPDPRPQACIILATVAAALAVTLATLAANIAAAIAAPLAATCSASLILTATHGRRSYRRTPGLVAVRSGCHRGAVRGRSLPSR